MLLKLVANTNAHRIQFDCAGIPYSTMTFIVIIIQSKEVPITQHFHVKKYISCCHQQVFNKHKQGFCYQCLNNTLTRE